MKPFLSRSTICHLAFYILCQHQELASICEIQGRCKTITRQTGPCDDVSFTTAGVRIGFGPGRGLRCTALTRQKRIRRKKRWHEFGKRERERGNGGADFGSPDLTRGASGTGPEILETKMPEMPDGRHGDGNAVRWAALTLVNGRQEFAK